MVGGHAVFLNNTNKDISCDTNWYLYDFQKGEPKFYIEHIKAGVEEASKDDESLLIFSGGQTREAAGPISESQSYWSVAEKFAWWDYPEVKIRSTTEEFARDSFENILFSICRFYECTNRFPSKITAIGWGFKKERYFFHIKTLKFPTENFKFISVNNPIDLQAAMDGELNNCRIPYTKDPLGSNIAGVELLCKNHEACIVSKKRKRNPFRRFHPYKNSCPQLADLVQYDTPCIPHKLPW